MMAQRLILHVDVNSAFLPKRIKPATVSWIKPSMISVPRFGMSGIVRGGTMDVKASVAKKYKAQQEADKET